jgi:hypothetical protein
MHFNATFLEKVAQKAAFRETLALPCTSAPGRLTKIALKAQRSILLMRFDVSKLSVFQLASSLRSALINRRKVGARALKAALEAKSREGRAIRATTIFFWFFSYEKEMNEKNVILPNSG